MIAVIITLILYFYYVAASDVEVVKSSVQEISAQLPPDMEVESGKLEIGSNC